MDKKAIKTKQYFYQAAMFGLSFCNYAVLHCTRVIWSDATKDFTDLYDISSTEVAAMNMCFLVCYAIGNMTLGQMADRYNKNRFVLVMYSSVAVVVLCLGLLHLVED